MAFATCGYANVRLEEIARAAHATTGAIYHHFGGKAGLLLAVGEHVEAEVVAAISARVPPGAMPWEAIEAVTDATLDICARPEIAGIIFREAPNVLGAAEWREVEMRYGRGGLEALFRRAAAAGQLAPDDPVFVTRLMMAALIAAVGELVGDGGQVRATMVHVAMRRLLNCFRRV